MMDQPTLVEAMGNTVISDEEVDAFNAAMLRADITNERRAAMWCAQLGEESAGLRYYEEIASGAEYEGRSDLGNTQPGDGVRFKGRGPIQVTGRHNYAVLSQWAAGLGYVDSPTFFVDNPAKLSEIHYGFLGAVWYWTTQRPLNDLADAGDVYGATRAINGGLNGINDRLQRYSRCVALGSRLLPEGDDEMAGEAQDVQTQLRGPGLNGWPAWLYDKLVGDQPKLSLVDFTRGIHQKVVSRLTLDQRPHPKTEADDLFGHVLSTRAEIAELTALVKKALGDKS